MKIFLKKDLNILFNSRKSIIMLVICFMLSIIVPLFSVKSYNNRWEFLFYSANNLGILMIYIYGKSISYLLKNNNVVSEMYAWKIVISDYYKLGFFSLSILVSNAIILFSLSYLFTFDNHSDIFFHQTLSLYLINFIDILFIVAFIHAITIFIKNKFILYVVTYFTWFMGPILTILFKNNLVFKYTFIPHMYLIQYLDNYTSVYNLPLSITILTLYFIVFTLIAILKTRKKNSSIYYDVYKIK